MGELEDKINSILSSPEEMEKIMGLARSLSGSFGGSPASEPNTSTKKHSNDNTSGFGNIDPKMLSMLSKIMGEYNKPQNDKSALISAMKPYLKEDRRDKLDKALQIAKAAHIAKVVFSDFGGGDKNQ